MRCKNLAQCPENQFLNFVLIKKLDFRMPCMIFRRFLVTYTPKMDEFPSFFCVWDKSICLTKSMIFPFNSMRKPYFSRTYVQGVCRDCQDTDASSRSWPHPKQKKSRPLKDTIGGELHLERVSLRETRFHILAQRHSLENGFITGSTGVRSLSWACGDTSPHPAHLSGDRRFCLIANV